MLRLEIAPDARESWNLLLAVTMICNSYGVKELYLEEHGKDFLLFSLPITSEILKNRVMTELKNSYAVNLDGQGSILVRWK